MTSLNSADAFLVAITRCSGIILGVGVSVILASFVFPKSASHQAADNLASALDGLCRLCDLAWNSAYLGRPQAEDLSDEGFYMQLDHAEPEHQAAIGSASAKEAECEKVIYASASLQLRLDESMDLSRLPKLYFMYSSGCQTWCSWTTNYRCWIAARILQADWCFKFPLKLYPALCL